MLNKKLMILTIILVSLFAVSAVSAADDAASEVVSVEENQVILSENNDVGTFDDLQSEIDNATEGSVLNLTRDYNGAYGSRIQLNKNLTIDGQGHTLDCLGKGGCSAFYSNSGTITLKNLKIINGHNDFNNKGGAIYIEGSAQYTIINCTFNNNWADDYGGAIYNGVDKPLTIINSSFDKNTADDDNGGAIYSKGDLDIINSTFTSNNADDDGGAIYCEKSVSVENSLFEKNKAKVDGGAIYSKNNVTVTKNTRFYSNNATGATSAQCYGGAIRSEGNVEVEGSSFNDNIAGDYGGAIYAKSASISSARFERNKADDNYGGAVYVEDSVDAISTTFSSNHAGDHGGAIYSKNRIFAKNTRFTSNYARHKGSSVRCEGDVIIEDCYSAYNWAYNQGSIAAAGDIYIKNSEFRKDRVTNFGAAVYGEKNIYVDNGYFSECHAQEKGGAIYCKNNVIAVNSRFDGNVVYYSWEEDSWKNEGGAIYSKGDVAIDNCYFIRNEAREAGGAIYADTITWGNSSSEFRDNYATYTGGGAIYVNKFNTDVKYGIFINNYISAYKVEKDGGAIYINKENHVTFSHCYFENNRCTDEGGAIYLDSTKSHLTLEYNIFINNKANDKGNIVYNKGTYDKIHNNWYGSNSFDFSNELVEYNTWGSDKSHEDDEQVIVELSLDENPIAGQPSTVIVTFISDGELFNYGAGFRADNGAKLTNKKTGNNTVTSDIAFDDGITTVTATVNRQVLKLSYSYSKQNVTMDITAQEISFGDNATVNVILTPDNATGKVSVGNIFSTIVNGTATLIIPDLSAGNQTLLVSYSGDGVYKAKQENVTITVNRKNLNIDASAKPIVKGDNATVIVTGLERATGNVTVTINNADWTGEIRNGTATIIIPGLNQNTTANVTYLGDANYINASTTVYIIVNPVKMNLTIIASADPIMLSEDAIVVVTGLENATGNVTVTIGGDEWYGEINNGTATVIVTGLKLNATAGVFYAGDYLYNNASTTVNITVTPTIFVWYVNGSKESSGNGTTPDTAFKTLKEALRKAPENSTIYIAPGTYTGENNINLTINKNNLTLVNYGAGEVIFDAQSGSRILTVNAGRINITGLTFKNGKEEYVCGAIFFNQTLNNSYINAIFIDNNVVDGLAGAIGFYADVINTDINSVFINNSVNNGYGGAIFFNGNLNNVNISGNYTANKADDYGGAILFNGDLNNVCISGNYTANIADDSGGAIFFNGNLNDVNISGYYNNNQANDTGGVFLFTNNLTNVIISGEYSNNVARFCAVYYMSEFATINNSCISGDYYNNSASYCVVLLIEGIISNSNISGNYFNNHAIMGIDIIGEAHNVKISGNYINNNISNGSAIYIGYFDENSVIHDSIFINNTIDDELIIDVESGSVLSVNNWFGNNATNYNIKPKVSENVTMVNWLFLNATTNITSEIAVNETAEITFKLYAYNSTSGEIKEYDASEMNIELDLSQRSGALNQTTALINQAILYTCGEEGIASVTCKFETASYTIILAKQSTEIIINETEMTLKVNDSVSAGATLNPPEAGNLTYASSDAGVAVVENGVIKCLNEGTAIITVSFAGNDEYAPAASKNITVYVDKRIPVIIASADVTENIVTIHVDIDGYDGWISMNLFDSLIYLPISSSLNFTQSLAPGTYNVNITSLGNYMFYSGSEILTFTVPEPEKLNTSISAQSSVNENTVTITVDVDSNASGLVEISIAGREYYVPVVNGTAVFINDYSSGNYVADVTYIGDGIYNPNATKTEFSIVGQVKENTTIALDVDVVENNVTYTVNVDKDATGLVKFELSGDEANVVYVDVKDGQAVLDVLLESGNYTVVATYLGNDRFNTNITYKEFTVIGHVKKDTPITAEADVNGYKVTITVDVVSDATGFVKLQFGDTIANVELENGKGTYTTTLPAGSYNVDLTYLGDENYNKNSTQTAFTVTDPAKENTTIGLEIAVDENMALFNASVDKSASGLVKFQVFSKESGENQTFYMGVENGEAISSMLFEKGNYTVIATYMGDDVFNTNTTSKDFEIIGHVMKDTPITAEADVNGYKVTVTVNVDDDATGFVEVKYDDTIVNIALTNGTGTYTTTLPAGSYNVDLTYLGDENYNSNSTKLSFSIADPVKENTSISLDVETVENTAIFTVNVDKDATGLVKFEVSSDEASVVYVDVKDGQAVLDVLLDAGNHTVVATYMGDDRFNTNITYKEFTVLGHVKKDTAIDVKADTNYNKVTITVNVDSNATGFVKLSIGDTVANIEIENGVATFTTTLPAGSYYVQATYLGDEDYNANSTQTTFTITEAAKQNTAIGLDISVDENMVLFNVSVDKSASGLVKFQVLSKESGENRTFYVDAENGAAVSSMLFEKGNYTVIATYMGDDVFNSNATSKDFEIIGHVMKDTSITAEADVNGYKFTITVNVNDDATGFVEVKYGDTVINIALTNGTGTYTTTLPAGSYNVDLTYLGDENYNSNSTKLSFNIADPVKENTPISLDVETVENTAIFTVNVDKDATGLVKFEVDDEIGTVLYAEVNDGQAVLSGLLEAGNYTVVATYMGDDRFNSNITSESFTVKGHVKKDTPISADADVNGYKVTITVGVDLDATGFVKLQIGDTIANVELENGMGTYTTTLLAGSYYVQATYLGDEDYNANSTQTTFTITEAEKQNTAIGLDISVDENMVLFNVSVDKSASGLVKFQVLSKESGENRTFYVDVENGAAVSSMLFEKGNYTVIATYMGDDVFNSNNTSKDFEIIGHVMKDTPITAEADVNGYKVTITVDVDDDATGFVEVKYGDTVINIALTNGTGVYTTTLPVGSYNVDLAYLGDENYNKNSTKLSFNIADPVKENTTISLDVQTIENNVLFTVNVDNNATGLVKFELSGDEANVVYVDVKDGQAVLDVLLESGDYSVVATYMGDDRFNSNITSESFTVKGHVKKDTPISADADVNGNKVTITVNVDENATGFVTLKQSGSVIYLAVENGVATYAITLPAGSYNVEVTYLGDDDYNENSTRLLFTVVEAAKENTPIIFNVSIVEDNATFTVNVNLEATGIVKFEVSGAENYTVYADVLNGVAVLDNVLQSGDYTVVATYMGDDRFNSNSTMESFTVLGHIKLNTSINCDVVVNDYDVTLTVNVNESSATGFVEINIAGKTYYVPVENGKAIFAADFLAGNYMGNVNYLGDDYFNPASTLVYFSVVEKNVTLENTSIEVIVSSVDNDVSIVAVVNSSATGLVEFIIDDTVVYLPIDNGECGYELVLPAGEYNVTVTYLGDSKFNPNSTTEEFVVYDHIKLNTSINCDVVVNDYDVTLTVNVNESSATGFVEINIAGKTYYVPVENGKAIFAADFLAGTYMGNAKYLGDDYFNPAITLIYFNVAKQNLENTSIEVIVSSDDNDVSIVAIVNSSATGFVEFIIGDAVVYLPIDNGECGYELVLPAGEYNVTVTYLGDSKFNPNSTTEEFVVYDHIKLNTSINCDVVVNDNDVTLTVNVNESSATGFVEINIAGKTYYVPVENGKAIFAADFLAGNYMGNVNYLGDDYFNPASTLVYFSVVEKNVTLENTTLEVIVSSVDNDVSIVAVVNSSATGFVEFIIGDTVVYQAVNNGECGYELVLPAGEYNVTVTYLGDSKFNPNSTTEEFVVYDHIKLNTSINCDVVVNDYDVTLTVNVNESSATGFVEINIAGKTYYVPVENGKAIFAADFLAGTYMGNAKYLGDDYFNPAITLIYFNVAEQNVTLENTSIEVIVSSVDNDVSIVAVVNSSATGFVEFIIGDAVVYQAVNNGECGYELVLPAGEYNVTVTYLGDSKFNPNSTTEEFVVYDHIKLNTSINCDVVVNDYDVTLTVNVNESSATGFVEINIAGKTYYVPVENGKAIFAADFLAGTYMGNAKYLGDDYFNPAITLIYFNVAKQNLENTSIEVIVSSDDNDVSIVAVVNSSATGFVEFIIGDAVVYQAVNNGECGYELVLPAGEYNVTVTYLGDSKFNPNSTTEEFVVYDHIKLNTSINCDVVVNDYDVTLTVNVNESSATGFVEINIAGKTYYVLVENGKAVFVSDFIPGTYSCNVTYLGDDYFNPAETIVSFTVSQKNDSLANTTIDVEIGGFENDVIITAFVNESATGLIEFIIEDKAVYIAVNNGKAVYDVVLPAGEYNVMVTYLGDYKFSSNSTSRDFIVQDHMKLNTSIAGNVSVDGYNVTLTAEVIKFATGFVEFSLNGNSIFAELNDGVAVVNAVFLSGEYTVTATYLGDDDFNSNSTNITFRVDEIPQNETSIDSIVEINENNVTITVIVNENATGFVEFDFIGAESFTYYAPVIDGIAVYGGVLAAGRYVVEITYLGDEKFDTNTTTERFEVTGHIKKNTTLDCDVSVNGYLVNLTVNLESDATGFVCFFTGASEYYAPINDGKAVLMFNMHPGNYTFTVVYDGDENYNSANATVEIYVPEIEPEDANLTVSAVNSTITVTVNEEATGYVLVDVDGTGYYAIIEDGQATVNVIGLDEGEYEASVIYSGDDVFAPANATVSVTVPSSGKNDTPVDPEANISISAEGVEVSLPEDATGYVLIDVDGTGYYTAVENGKATFELPKLDLGNHTVSVTYTGDNKYASANATANVTIDGPVETIISDNLTKVEKAPDRFEAVFTDAEGNPLANTEVTFEIKGNVYKRTTDASGKAGMNINLESGVYEVKITNPVTGEVKFNTITVKSRFEDAHDLVKYFRNDSQYRIKVLGDDGNIAPKGTVVKFNINGVFYERSVDENGYVKMNINLNPGTYIITGEYKGCRVSNTITVLPILTADDLVKKYGEANPFEAKLVDGQGNPYANQKLEFNINGVFYYRTTNSNGIAKLNINLMPSAYIITTRYGDAALSNNVIVTT